MSEGTATVMFEVYRECGFSRRYHVVFFTDLEEAERDAAIDAAMAGESFFHGYIEGRCRDRARNILERYVARLNTGSAAAVEELEGLLRPFLVS